MMRYTNTQSPSVRFVTVLVANLLAEYVDNKSTKWSLSISMNACDNDYLQLSVFVAMCFKYYSQRSLSCNKKHLKNVGPIRHSEPPHALILHCHSPGVATVARRLRIDVHDNNDNAWQRGPLWPIEWAQLHSAYSAIWSTLCEAASRDPSALADIRVSHLRILFGLRVECRLGCVHDEQDNRCSSSDRHIMAASPGPLTDDVYKNAYTFSRCSIDEMQTFLALLTQFATYLLT